MGYRDRNGIVGQYRGADVYVIAYEDFTESMTKTVVDTIFAVRDRGQSLTLVQDGKIIGSLWDDGRIETTRNLLPFRFYEKKKKNENKKKEEPVELPKAVVDDYSIYSNVVDNFFAGLNKLWEEIDAGLKV